MKKISLLLGAGVLALLFSGCTHRIVDFTIISTKNVDLSKAANFKRGKTREQGQDKKHIIILIPTGIPNMKEAVDRAIEKVPGAVALVDGVVYYHWWYIPYIYGQSSYVVEGLPLIDSSLASQTVGGDYMVAVMDSKGEVGEFRCVTKQEFEALKR